jgi:hypothetical protein
MLACLAAGCMLTALPKAPLLLLLLALLPEQVSGARLLPGWLVQMLPPAPGGALRPAPVHPAPGAAPSRGCQEGVCCGGGWGAGQWRGLGGGPGALPALGVLPQGLQAECGLTDGCELNACLLLAAGEDLAAAPAARLLLVWSCWLRLQAMPGPGWAWPRPAVGCLCGPAQHGPPSLAGRRCWASGSLCVMMVPCCWAAWAAPGCMAGAGGGRAAACCCCLRQAAACDRLLGTLQQKSVDHGKQRTEQQLLHVVLGCCWAVGCCC